jgi:hypothetical protein
LKYRISGGHIEVLYGWGRCILADRSLSAYLHGWISAATSSIAGNLP